MPWLGRQALAPFLSGPVDCATTLFFFLSLVRLLVARYLHINASTAVFLVVLADTTGMYLYLVVVALGLIYFVSNTERTTHLTGYGRTDISGRPGQLLEHVLFIFLSVAVILNSTLFGQQGDEETTKTAVGLIIPAAALLLLLHQQSC